MNAFKTRKSKIDSTKRKNWYVKIYFKGGGAENWFRNIDDKGIKFRVFKQHVTFYLIYQKN